MKFRLLCSAVLVAGLITSSASAAITAFSDNFQGYNPAPGNTFAPWEGFSNNAGLGNYSFAPSTSGPQITALGDDGAGNSYMNFYANYDNGAVHGNPPRQEAISVFRNMPYTAADTAGATTWAFKFDYREADIPPGGSTEVGAFIRVFDGAFNLIGGDTLDTSGSSSWQNGVLTVTLDPIWTNGFFQVGFNNLVGSYQDSGMFYDNARLNVVPEPGSLVALAIGSTVMVVRRRRRS